MPLPAALTCCLPSRSSQPFDEINLKPKQVRALAQTLHTQGYCSIALTQVTQRHLQSLQAEGPWSLNSRFSTTTKQQLSDQVEHQFLNTAHALLQELTGQKLLLRTHECELRRPERSPAASWHTDKGPKLLTFLSTLQGRKTQYVAPKAVHQHFDFETRAAQEVPIPQHDEAQIPVEEMPEGYIHILATPEVDKLRDAQHITPVPALVHRAPGEEAGRTILLVRVKPA